MITFLSEEHPRPGRAGLSQTWALDPTSSWLNGKATVKCSKCMSAMPLYHTCLSSTQTQVLWYNRTSAVIRWAIRELKTITENLPGSAAQHVSSILNEPIQAQTSLNTRYVMICHQFSSYLYIFASHLKQINHFKSSKVSQRVWIWRALQLCRKSCSF